MLDQMIPRADVRKKLAAAALAVAFDWGVAAETPAEALAITDEILGHVDRQPVADPAAIEMIVQAIRSVRCAAEREAEELDPAARFEAAVAQGLGL
jgi:hypothetical protein